MEVMVMLSSEFWCGKKVFLTGHTGFKGSWLLVWLLQLGADITGFSLPVDSSNHLFNSIWPSLNGKFTHIEGDLKDYSSLNAAVKCCRPEVVINLAAQSLVRKSYIDPLETWSTNVIGSLNILKASSSLPNSCAIVMVTTDKVYLNKEWSFGYREIDRLGGFDPYSASKAATELAIESWRSSFCGTAKHQSPYMRIASARAGNVIGGGDYSEDRIVPDAIRSLKSNKSIEVRHPYSKRPWQHVLEPLGGYLLLAQKLVTAATPPCEAFNFGPSSKSNCSVEELVCKLLEFWPGEWNYSRDDCHLHEASRLHLQIDKAMERLGWSPKWDFSETVRRTVLWYQDVYKGADPYERTLSDIKIYREVLES